MEKSLPSLKPSAVFHLRSFLRSVLRPMRIQRNWRLFSSPARRDSLRPRSQSHRVRPIVLRAEDGTRLSGWLMSPRWPEARGAVLYFGNGSEEALWLAGQAQTLFPDMTILVMRYREAEGRPAHPAIEQLVADGEMLYDWLADSHRHLPGFPVVVMGRDFGAAVAVKVAAERPAAALALLTPCDSRHREKTGRFGLLRRAAKSGGGAAFLFKHASPVLVLRAQYDEIVRPANIDVFVARLPVKTRDLTIAGADHHDLPYREEAHAAITAFLQEHIPGQTGGKLSVNSQLASEPSLVLAA